jgi:AFG3 family protein
MNNRVGPLSFSDSQQENQFQKPYSDETATLIDKESRQLVIDALDRTVELLTGKKEDVEKVAQLLLEKEVITREDMERLVGKRPFADTDSIYDEYVRGKVRRALRVNDMKLTFVRFLRFDTFD